MKKLILTILLLSIITFVSADGDIGLVKQGECISLYNYCPTCSYINLTAISYPNGTTINSNLAMTKSNSNFNYTFCTTSQLGEYRYTTCGDKSGVLSCEDIKFESTPTGKAFTQQVITTYIISVVILIFFLIAIIFLITKLPTKDAMDEEGVILQVSNLKHLRPVLWGVCWAITLAIIFIIGNIALAYLPTGMVGNLFMTIFIILFGVTLIAVPLWFIWIFTGIFRDKEFKRMMSRGVELRGTP